MADEPKNSQQIIDNATNALGQTVVKPPKKKGGKGMLIGMLLFLILTLPVAIYYGMQQYTQITEQRGRAAGTRTCYSTLASCQSACRPTATPTTPPSATNTPVSTSTPTIANTSAPGTCDASCDTDSNCESGLSCYSVTGIKRCRKEACPDRSNCECPLADSPATPTTRYYQPREPTATPTTESVIAEAPVATATQRPTPKVPVSGVIDVKAIVITVASILLLALGLIL